MKRLTIALAMVALLLCSNCNKYDSDRLAHQVYEAASSIQFTKLDNYFVRNDVDCSKEQRLIIYNKTDFENIFGMAAYMGGLPTEIDWNKQCVMALILPETNRETTISPIDVRQDGEKVVLCYHLEQAQETMSHTIVPFTAIAIEKPAGSQPIKIFFLKD